MRRVEMLIDDSFRPTFENYPDPIGMVFEFSVHWIDGGMFYIMPPGETPDTLWIWDPEKWELGNGHGRKAKFGFIVEIDEDETIILKDDGTGLKFNFNPITKILSAEEILPPTPPKRERGKIDTSLMRCIADTLVVSDPWLRSEMLRNLDFGDPWSIAVAMGHYWRFKPTPKFPSTEKLLDWATERSGRKTHEAQWYEGLEEGHKRYIEVSFELEFDRLQEWKSYWISKDDVRHMAHLRNELESVRWLMLNDEVDQRLHDLDKEMKLIAWELDPDGEDEALWRAGIEPGLWWAPIPQEDEDEPEPKPEPRHIYETLGEMLREKLDKELVGMLREEVDKELNKEG